MKLSKKEIIISLLILFIITIINFSGIFAGNYPMNEVDSNWVFSFKFYFAKMFQERQFPLWNNLSFAGMPFYDQDISCNPCNFTVFILAFLSHFFRNPYFIFSLTIMLQIFLMGWFTYFVSRRVFGLMPLVSYFPAIIYMLNMGQMERVAWMPGGFVVAPLMILFADKISHKDKFLTYSILAGFIQALGFYFGSFMASAWAGLIFIYFLIYFSISRNGFNLAVFKKIITSAIVTYAFFFFLSATVLIPFIYNVSSQHNLQARFNEINLSQFFNLSWFRYGVSEIFFANLFGLQNSLSTAAFDISLLTKEMADSLLFNFFFSGNWNYWTILFYPLIAITIFNLKLFSKKEFSILLLILIYIIHFFLLAFNHLAFFELLLLRGHNLLFKLQFIMQLIGGLFIGILFNKILLSSEINELKFKTLKLAKIICYPILIIYSLINLFFLSGVIFNIFTKNKLDILIQKCLRYLVENLNILSGFKNRYGNLLIAKLNDTTGLIIKHFFSSEFTARYLFLFTCRLIIISLFLFLLISILKRTLFRKKAIILATLILAFFIFERIDILKLYCPFNQDAPKNFSEDYKEIRYLRHNLEDFDRIVVFTNDYNRIVKYLNKEYGIPVSKQNTLSVIDKESYYNIWKNFPESYRNGMPLMYTFNLPYKISAFNGLFPNIMIEIWDVYHQINLDSDFYRSWIQKIKGVTDGDFNIYSIESPLIDLFGIKYVLSSIPLDSQKLTFILKGDKYYLYQNKKTFPRVWIVDNYKLEGDKKKILDLMRNNEVNLLTTALLDTEAGLQELNLDKQKLLYQVNIDEYAPNFVKIKAQVNKKSLLVFSDTYYKNWEAYVNGKKEKIRKVNYLLRGIFLNSGENEVIFNFRPKIFFYSLVISVVTSMLIFLYFIFVVYYKKRIAE